MSEPLDDAGRGSLPPTVEWVGGADGCLRLIDQTRLPQQLVCLDCGTVEQVWEAIRSLRVRGAPAIGVAAAYGLCLGTRHARTGEAAVLQTETRRVADYLCSARPTAVNLAWAVRRVAAAGAPWHDAAAWNAMLAEAHALAREDVEVCRRLGLVGAPLVPEGGGVLTHCNAGALAAVRHGTALAVLYEAWRRGVRFRVYADETRPLLQGARLTSYELRAAGLDVTVICDSAAAALMRANRIQLVVVGADRIAANGDTANKIGTYALAVLARHHKIPFYVVAPRSTFDPALPTGDGIPIEERSADEVRSWRGEPAAAADVACCNPAFDVTPADLITGIITEVGVAQPLTVKVIQEILRANGLQAPSPDVP